jgi:hypothetical protein
MTRAHLLSATRRTRVMWDCHWRSRGTESVGRLRVRFCWAGPRTPRAHLFKKAPGRIDHYGRRARMRQELECGSVTEIVTKALARPKTSAACQTQTLMVGAATDGGSGKQTSCEALRGVPIGIGWYGSGLSHLASDLGPISLNVQMVGCPHVVRSIHRRW